MKFTMTGQEKVTFNTGDCLIESRIKTRKVEMFRKQLLW